MARRLVLGEREADPLIYFARGMEGLHHSQVKVDSALREEFVRHRLTLVDPLAEQSVSESETAAFLTVRADLGLLRRCDGVLMDMSIAGRNYVGCCCELVYAYLWLIPVVVFVEDSGNGDRLWLRYHAATICRKRSEAMREIARLTRGQNEVQS